MIHSRSEKDVVNFVKWFDQKIIIIPNCAHLVVVWFITCSNLGKGLNFLNENQVFIDEVTMSGDNFNGENRLRKEEGHFLKFLSTKSLLSLPSNRCSPSIPVSRSTFSSSSRCRWEWNRNCNYENEFGFPLHIVRVDRAVWSSETCFFTPPSFISMSFPLQVHNLLMLC